MILITLKYPVFQRHDKQDLDHTTWFAKETKKQTNKQHKKTDLYTVD